MARAKTQPQPSTLTLETEALKSTLRILRPALGSGNVLPMFRSFLFHENSGKLCISAATTELMASMTMDAEPPATPFAVDAEKLLACVGASSSASTQITPEFDGAFVSARYTNGRLSAKLVAYDGKDFPISDKSKPDGPTLSVSDSAFARSTPFLVSCVAQNAVVRPSLMYVYVTQEEGGAYGYASDTYRIARAPFGVAEPGLEPVLLSAQSLKIIGHAPGDVTIQSGEQSVWLSRGAIVVRQARFAYDFPDAASVVRGVTGLGVDLSITTEPGVIVSAIKSVGLFAENAVGSVARASLAVVGEDTISVSAGNDDQGSATFEVPCKLDGKLDAPIYFNPSYLFQMVSSFPASGVDISVRGHALLITAGDTDAAGVFSLQVPS